MGCGQRKKDKIMKKIFNLIHNSILALAGKEFNLPINDWETNAPLVNFVITEKYCNIKVIEIDNMLSEILTEQTKGEYQYTYVNYKRDGFGFSQGYPSFCHTSKIVGTTESLEELCKNNTLFIIHSVNTEKGRKATWLCPIDLIDSKTEELLYPYIQKAIIEVYRRKAIDDCYAEKERLAALEHEKALKELGIDSVKKVVINDWYNNKKYEYHFDKNIDRDTFIKFLTLEGEVVKAKPCYLPISPETVDFHQCWNDPNTWVYHWLGECTD